MDNPEKLTREVTQWLAEIGALRQQLADANHAIAEARASAEHWRSLYNTEAEQRRRESDAARAQMAALQDAETGRSPQSTGDDAERQAHLSRELANLSAEELRAALLEASVTRDRLLARVERLQNDLDSERANHAKTRTDLTTALADAVALLSKAKEESIAPDSR